MRQVHQEHFFKVDDGGLKSQGEERGKGEFEVYPAEIIVDRGVDRGSGAIAPRIWDFFLQAHAATGCGR